MTTPPLDIHSLLSLPRPAAINPNPAATLATLASSTFNFTTNYTNNSIYLVNLTDTTTTTPILLLEKLSSNDSVWLDDTTILYTTTTPNSTTTQLQAFDTTTSFSYPIGTLPVSPISNLSLHPSITPKSLTLVFSTKSYPSRDLYSFAKEKKLSEEKKEGSDGRVYDSLFVRHWDEWVDQDGLREGLFWVGLRKDVEDEEVVVVEGEWNLIPKGIDGVKRGWTLVEELRAEEDESLVKKPVIHSPLTETKLECPVGAFGDKSDFNLSKTHIVFHSKDPHVSPAWHTRTQIYLSPLSPKSAADSVPKQLTVGTQGASSSPVFSKDGKRIAWLEMSEDGYEADENNLIIYEIEEGERWKLGLGDWDRSPKSVKWCPSGEKIYLLADDGGHVKLFYVPVPPSKPYNDYKQLEPTRITYKHTISSFTPLTPTSLILSINSFTSPNEIFLLNLEFPSPASTTKPPKTTLTKISSLTPTLTSNFHLSKGEEFVFPGAKGRSVHGFILFPEGYENWSQFTEEESEGKEKKTWPLAFLVHGGPQSAWNNSWSTRWNLNSYTGKGYITVAINPTGSTGYGQEFCDDIKNQWGGYPFQDLVSGLEFVKNAWPEIDGERTAMLGASYGGFMANWIQGHNEQTNFKAIVCHDGVFSTAATWFGTEELYFPEREFGGLPWTVPENYSRWNPQNFINKWKTPQLVIHSARDFRLNESEGVGVFNTLQRLGIPSRFLHFPSENHWILSPHNGVKWHDEVFRWIDEWTAEAKIEN